MNFSNLFICNIKRKSKHCMTQCLHGIPHLRDKCTTEEFCNLHASGKITKVKCRKLTTKEIKEWKKKK